MDEKEEKQNNRRNELREKLLRGGFISIGQDYCHAITVGRSFDNDIIINYSDIERHHCLIEEIGEERFRIIDLDSANGTFVNGMRVKGSMEIGPYDEVLVGTYHVAWLHQFSRPETTLTIPPGGHLYTGKDEPPLTQQEEGVEDGMKRKRDSLRTRGLIDPTVKNPEPHQEECSEDAMKKKREELSRRLLNGETIAFGEGGKIVDVDSEEAIGTIPFGKFS